MTIAKGMMKYLIILCLLLSGCSTQLICRCNHRTGLTLPCYEYICDSR